MEKKVRNVIFGDFRWEFATNRHEPKDSKKSVFPLHSSLGSEAP